MSKLEKLKEHAKGLEARDPKRAIEAWLEVFKVQESEGDPNPDLAIFNRIGDLYLKLKDSGHAADYYDRAVDRYAELGFHNNAIAMCNKVLRNAPARQTTYLKLAKLYAAKGFIAEARQNFVEYAERMQRAGKIQQAFAALKEVTDLSPESDNLRHMLEEHLRMYGEPSRKSVGRLSTPPPRPRTAPPAAGGGVGAGKDKRKTSTLVFLDVDAPPRAKGKPAGRAAPPAAEPEHIALVNEVEPEPDTSLEIETTSLADAEEDVGSGGLLEGLETTHTDLHGIDAIAARTPSLRDDDRATDEIEPMAGLEPTIEEEEEEEVEERVPAPRVEPTRVRPVVPKRPMPPPPARPAAAPLAPPAPPKRKTVVEIPPLELEPDFDTVIGESEHDVDDQPLADILTEDDTSITLRRKSGYIDLGVDGVVNQGDQAASLVFDNIAEEEAPAAPSIEELEGQVADDPDNAALHRTLGEALIEVGERERGIEELDLATAGFEAADDLQAAQDLVEEILRLDPNSIRHRQKQVEFAFKASDKGRLIEAYLELADTLLRSDLPDKARAVYERVAEHDRGNERARGALAMLAPAAPGAVEAPAAPRTTAPTKAKEGKVAAKDAKMKVRDEAGAADEFVDLGTLILEEDDEPRDTRMKVADEEPTGDEERDFQDMLARFKQGIDENIADTDFQSHYDLGIAFKEMGLLDEAIAELQKALRAPEGKLRTSEALGVCFVEKGAHVVAESILRRGLELPASSDEERLGVLYWLGRALEGQGRGADARELYGRVFAVNIRFRDVGERIKTLAKAK